MGSARPGGERSLDPTIPGAAGAASEGSDESASRQRMPSDGAALSRDTAPTKAQPPAHRAEAISTAQPASQLAGGAGAPKRGEGAAAGPGSPAVAPSSTEPSAFDRVRDRMFREAEILDGGEPIALGIPTPTATGPSASAGRSSTPASLPQAPILPADDLGLTTEAGGAKLRIAETRAGDLNLDLRLQDGNLDIRASGAAAKVLGSHEAELRITLAGAGLRLGQLDVDPGMAARAAVGLGAAEELRKRGRAEERGTKKPSQSPTSDPETRASVSVKA